jgi:hypothetical protein
MAKVNLDNTFGKVGQLDTSLKNLNPILTSLMMERHGKNHSRQNKK